MVMYKIIGISVEVLMLVYVVFDLGLSLRTIKYQREWDKEKSMRLKMKPAITRPELCEFYVMFCIRNNCKVDF